LIIVSYYYIVVGDHAYYIGCLYSAANSVSICAI